MFSEPAFSSHHFLGFTCKVATLRLTLSIYKPGICTPLQKPLPCSYEE